MKQIFTAMIFSFCALSALAGGWVSGGGNILRNANNPWFLENTQVVEYCIMIDSVAFADLPTPVDILIEKALAFWKTQMADSAAGTDAYPIGGPGSPSPLTIIKIATQEFVPHQKCNGTEPLVFQFGTLTPEQSTFIGNSGKVIGMAVRTEYDETNLRGRGFIYLASDNGSMKYEGEHLHAKAWHEGKGGLLFRAIVHELGHVFGLSHSGEGLMSEAYTESLLWEKSYRKAYADSFDLPSVFHFELSPLVSAQMLGSMVCQGPEGKLLFGPEFHFPMRAQLKTNGGDGYLITAKFDGTSDEILIGKLVGKTELRVPGHGFGVSVVLTDKQNVFNKTANNYLRLRGPGVHSGRFVGKFIPALKGGKIFDAILLLSPDSTTFDGSLNGKYYTDIMTWSYSSLGIF